MAEQAAVAEQAAEVEAKPTGTGDATGAEQKAEAVKTFTQEEVDRIVGERLKRAEAKVQEAAQKATAEAERKAAEEQGKFKELYEKAMADAQEAEAKRQALELSVLRERVARTVGLPEKLAGRLQGNDEESLMADAKLILAELPKPAAPNINSSSGNGNAPKAGQMTPEEKRELAARLGVNPNYL